MAGISLWCRHYTASAELLPPPKYLPSAVLWLQNNVLAPRNTTFQSPKKSTKISLTKESPSSDHYIIKKSMGKLLLGCIYHLRPRVCLEVLMSLVGKHSQLHRKLIHPEKALDPEVRPVDFLISKKKRRRQQNNT